MIYFLQMVSALLLDLLFGDPIWYPHPVRIIGKLIELSERFTRHLMGNLLIAGMVTVLLVLAATGGAVFLIISLAAFVSPVFSACIAVILVYMSIACRDLVLHSMAVFNALAQDDSLTSARKEIGKIVGRDTERLDKDGICRACIETVAENMVDGITAPLFWAVVASFFSLATSSLSAIECSAIGILLYKAVNTMDSMIGYKNDTYLHFGRVAAQLDDAVNFLPARLSGIVLILTSFILRLDYKNAAKIFFRDRNEHSSPNAGHTEAAVAGALNLRLGGPQNYFNKKVEKPYIGDDVREPVREDIKTTNLLVLTGSTIFFLLLIMLRMIIL